jgi:hypothetical protein
MWMGDIFFIDALIRKRSEILASITDLERQANQLCADLAHIDATLRMLDPDLEIETLPVRGPRPKRSKYFAHGEISRRCREALRDAPGDGWLSGDDIAVKAMRDKKLGPERDRRLRTDFVRRILQTLDSLERRYGRVVKLRTGRGIRWRLAEERIDSLSLELFS